MNPTAELADIVLPVASPFEREGLKIGFEVSAEAQSLVQLRQPVVAPPRRGPRRHGDRLRPGLPARSRRALLGRRHRRRLPSPARPLRHLARAPCARTRAACACRSQTRYRKYAEETDGVPAGFATPTRKIELYSETFLDHGYPPLPDFEEPLVSPSSRPDLAERFPLILTCAKSTPVLREPAPRPAQPAASAPAIPRSSCTRTPPPSAASAPGDWVTIETPEGSVRARARLNESLEPRVVCGQHGWWQACPEIGAPGLRCLQRGRRQPQPDHRQRGDRSGQRLGPPPLLSLPDPRAPIEGCPSSDNVAHRGDAPSTGRAGRSALRLSKNQGFVPRLTLGMLPACRPTRPWTLIR